MREEQKAATTLPADTGDERPREEQHEEQKIATGAETAPPPKLSHGAAALRVVVGLALTGALAGAL
ncbi:hypothetical protein FZI93_22005, partial [Mycobacterium sp. CBMA361]|nr:hypothetical protein [Mycolicibacterium sp. CBMA 361]